MTNPSALTLVGQSTQTQRMPNNENIWGRRSSILPSLSFRKTSEIEIVLDGENEFIHSYSTFDEITGHVNLRFEKETCIDDFAITLQGQTNTWVEKVATASPTMGRTTGKHTFMRVQQPIDTRYLPEFNKASAGQIYTVPFKFVVPDRVLDFACSHKVDSDHIRSCHLQLPPSIGDSMLAGQGNTLMDDLAPNMSKISYSIRVGLLKACPNLRKPDVVEESVGIRIIPAREELPPLSLDFSECRFANRYCLRKEKTVRRGIFKIGKKQGTLTAESFQPASFKLPHPAEPSDEPISTTATVQLRYDPASADEQPPSLSHITNKLRSHTFYGASPWSYLPAPEGYDIYSIVHSQYPQLVELSSRNLSNVEWVKHEPGCSSASASRSNSVAVPSASTKRNSKSFSTSISSSAGNPNLRSVADDLLCRRESILSSESSVSTTSTNDSSDSLSTCSASSAEVDQKAKSSITSPSTSYDATLPYYTASIVVPTTLPIPKLSPSCTTTSPDQSRRPSTVSPTQSRRPSTVSTLSSTNAATKTKPTRSHGHNRLITWLPTFHSCLISRLYSIELSIHAQGAPTLNLRLPVQMSLPLTTAPPTSPLISQPAFFDPFATDNDEAIARALASGSENGAAPGYEDAYHDLGPEEERISNGRRVSIPEPEAPPEYFSAVRQVTAARRGTVPENNRRGGNENSSNSSRSARNPSLNTNVTGTAMRRSKLDGRRFSLLTGL